MLIVSYGAKLHAIRVEFHAIQHENRTFSGSILESYREVELFIVRGTEPHATYAWNPTRYNARTSHLSR